MAIDRTNWYLGKKKYNVLVLGLAYEGISIPILWTWLDKAGNATGKEHLDIVKRFVKLFGKDCIEGILGDREFANKTLFQGLSEIQVPFYIRIKEGTQLRIKSGKFCKAKRLFNHLNTKEKGSFGMSVWISEVKVYLAGSRSERGELMIVASLKADKAAISKYLRRWEIENLFSALKSKGFRLEETHIQKQDRLEKLMALLAVALAWAHKVGEWQAIKKPIPFNHHKNSLYNSRRPQYTYFRYGLDFIRDCLIHFQEKSSAFLECLMQLILPITTLSETA